MVSVLFKGQMHFSVNDIVMVMITCRWRSVWEFYVGCGWLIQPWSKYYSIINRSFCTPMSYCYTYVFYMVECHPHKITYLEFCKCAVVYNYNVWW